MDVTDIASTATAMSQQKLGNDVQVAVLKKAMDIDAQSAAALIAAIPLPPSNPPHMGNSVDTYA
jgi:hypothetical protein